MRKLDKIKHTVRIEKFSRTTRLDAISNDNVLAWLGFRREEIDESPYILVGDLTHDVYRCSIGKANNWNYGKSLEEAVDKALIYYYARKGEYYEPACPSVERGA